MTTRIQLMLILLLVVALAAGAFAGAGNRAGTGGAAELLIPTGTRDIGMGGATIATSNGLEALFWNPAGVSKVQHSANVFVSHMSYIADIGVDYGAFAVNFEGFGVLALDLKALSIGEIPITTTQTPDGTGATFKPQFFTLGLTYSRKLTDRIAVGVTGTFIAERMADVSANGFAFNVGVTYDNLGSLDGLSIGVVVKNIGPQMKFDGPGLTTQAVVSDQNRGPMYYKVDAAAFELPSTLEFGVGYRRPLGEDHAVLFSGAFQNNNFSDDEYKLGVEYGFRDLLFVRGGYDIAPEESDQREYILGPAFGVGIHSLVGSVDVTFDYAYRYARYFDNNHIFSLKFGF